VLQCFDYLEKNEGFSVTRLPVDSKAEFPGRFDGRQSGQRPFWFP